MAGENAVTSTISVNNFKCFSDHSYKKQRDSLEAWTVLLIFLLELGMSGWLYWKYIKTEKMAVCCEDFHYGGNFDPVLAILCSYHYGVNISQAVDKIAIDEKDHKCSMCVTVCIATAYQ